MSIASRSARPVAVFSNGVSHSSRAASKAESDRSGQSVPAVWRAKAVRVWMERAALLQCRMSSFVARTRASRAAVVAGPGSAGPSDAPRTRLSRRRSTRARSSSRLGSHDRVAIRSTVEAVAAATASMSSASRGAASRMRLSFPAAAEPRPAASSSATTRNASPAKGSSAGSHAPPPPRNRNRAPPRACAIRSGYAKASTGPASLPDSPISSGVVPPGAASRHRESPGPPTPTLRTSSNARRRAPATAPPSACGWRALRLKRRRSRVATLVSISSGRPRRTSRSSSNAARAQAVPPLRPVATAPTTMRASLGCSGSPAISRPTAVGRPSASRAPRNVRRRRPSSSARGGGGSRKGNAAASPPHTASSRASPARSAVAISGSGKGRRAACSSFDHKR